MREIITIIKANIRRGKGSFISILVLTFLISLTLTAVLSINRNSAVRDQEAMDEAGFEDMFLMTDDKKAGELKIDIDTLAGQIEALSDVEEVETVPAVYAAIRELNKKLGNDGIMLMPYRPDELNYRIFNEDGSGLISAAADLKKGEVLAPLAFQSLYNCKEGDIMYLKGKEQSEGFRVAGFFEDPVMGGAMMGVKTVLMSEEDIKTLSASPDKNYRPGTFMNVERVKDSGLSTLKFEQKLNKETRISECVQFSLSRSQSQGYMLILVNIFSGILAAFVILLLVVVLIVLGHSINTSIEMEYKNIGILKAVGFTAGKLKAGMVIQYLLAVILGMLAGVPTALPVIRLVNRMTQPVTGLSVSDRIPMQFCMPALVAVLFITLLFVLRKVHRISGITPLKAIGGNREDVYFKSRPELPIGKRGLNILLAVRQLASGKRQYISACLITMLLTFFLIMVSGMSTWMGDDGKNLTQLFSCFEADMDVRYADENLKPEVEKIIEKESEIKDSFLVTTEYMMLDGCQLYAYICDRPEKYTTVYEGRTCKYDNEILITQFVADDLGIQIGDRVQIAEGNHNAEFIISGIYQSSNDMGSNFAMSQAGYKRLTGKLPDIELYTYELKKRDRTDKILQKVRDRYPEEKVMISDMSAFAEIGFIVDAIQGISVLIYMIASVFALTTIFMVCSKIFRRERRDYGIYKAMGFTSRALRLQFAVRFALVALCGSVLGIGMSFLLADKCLGIMLSFVGVSRLDDQIDLLSMILPGVFMVLLFFLASYFRARKIKKVEPTVLIGE